MVVQNVQETSRKLNNKVLSIVVGVYNPPLEKFKKCLESILNQSYKHLEIILLDDGSTNGAEMVCDNYALEDARVRVVHQKNYGAHAKFEIGYQLATGDYLTNVDHDDFIELDYYEQVMEVAQETDYDVIDTGYYHHDYRSGTIEKKYSSDRFEIIGAEAIVLASMTNQIAADSWCRIFKTSLMKRGQEWLLADPLTFLGAKSLVHLPYAGYHFINDLGTTSGGKLNAWMIEQLEKFTLPKQVDLTLSVYPFLRDYLYSSRLGWLMRVYFYWVQSPQSEFTGKIKDYLKYDSQFSRHLNFKQKIQYFSLTHGVLYIPYKIVGMYRRM